MHNNSWQVCFNRGTEVGGGGVNVGHALSPPPPPPPPPPPSHLFLLRACSSNDDIITIMGYDLPRTQTSLYKQTSKQELVLVYTKKKNLFQIGARKLLRRFSDDFPLLRIAPVLQTMQILILCIKLYALLVIVIL